MGRRFEILNNGDCHKKTGAYYPADWLFCVFLFVFLLCFSGIYSGNTLAQGEYSDITPMPAADILKPYSVTKGKIHRKSTPSGSIPLPASIKAKAANHKKMTNRQKSATLLLLIAEITRGGV